MRLIVAGSRTFRNYDLLKSKLDYLLSEVDESIEIVSGKARGADSLGERYARERGYTVREFPADWNKYGRAAGPVRNSQMAEYGTHLVVFWDGKSRGTMDMIDEAKRRNLEVRIVHFM